MSSASKSRASISNSTAATAAAAAVVVPAAVPASTAAVAGTTSTTSSSNSSSCSSSVPASSTLCAFAADSSAPVHVVGNCNSDSKPQATSAATFDNITTDDGNIFILIIICM